MTLLRARSRWLGTLVFCGLMLVVAPSHAERLVTRTDADLDGNFIAQLVAVARSGNQVIASSPVTLNSPLPAGATVDRVLVVNGGQHVVYAAFTGDAAIFDDLFVVDLATPGASAVLNGARVQGTEAPIVFAGVVGSPKVAYALRNFTTGTDRLFVADVTNPGTATLIVDGFPTGATIGDMELSPDGETLAYRLDQAGEEPQIWMSFLGMAPNARQIDLPVPPGDYQPNEFQFSPDSRRFLWRGKRTVPGQPEPLRMVTLDPFRQTISSAVQLNPGAVLNEQVFEFEIGADNQRVYYRSIAGNSPLPGDTFSVALSQPGVATKLNPAPVAGAGFTAQEDLLVVGQRVLYNSAQSRADLVELFSVPLDGSAVSTRLSDNLQLNQISSSESRPGVSHMVQSDDGAWVALVDGDPAQNLFVLDPDSPSRSFTPFNLTDLGATIAQSSRTNRTRKDPFRFSSDSEFLAILADPETFDPALDPPDIGSELLVALPDVDGSGRPVLANPGTVAGFDWLADRTALAAAVLPSSRSGQTGATLTAFVAMINGGANAAQACRITPVTSAPISFDYQTTDAQTNTPLGHPNTPVDIAPGGVQTWLVSMEVLGEFAAQDVELRYGCDNSDSVASIAGLNTILLSGSSAPVPDIVALAATPSQNGRVDIAGASGAAAFSVASVNVGSSSSITAVADTGGVALPVQLTLCETNSAGQCINPASASSAPVAFSASSGGTNTFSVFVTGTGIVGDNAALNRIRVLFRDSSGATRGQTSVAVRTLN